MSKLSGIITLTYDKKIPQLCRDHVRTSLKSMLTPLHKTPENKFIGLNSELYSMPYYLDDHINLIEIFKVTEKLILNGVFKYQTHEVWEYRDINNRNNSGDKSGIWVKIEISTAAKRVEFNDE